MKLRDIFRKREQTKRSDHHPSLETTADLNETDGWEFAADFISYPRVTEKSKALEKWRQYVFKVKTKANKIQIRRAIEKLYQVKVEKVRLINLPTKKTKLGRWEGEKPGMKKAIVKLKPGYKIETT